MRGSPLGAMLAASSLVIAGPAFAQIAPAKPPAKPAPKAAPPAPAPARVQTQIQATPAAPGAALDIKGFRSATFGMTPAQVKIALASDFGPAAKVQEGSNVADGTQFVLVSVEHLDPAPGAAQIGYVFGATSRVLTNVNVVWTTGAEPTEQQRADLAQAGEQLVAYFKTGPAPAKASGGISAFGTNGLVLYSAVDRKNAGVLIAIDGVQYKTTGDKPVASPPPKGPATLRVAYAVDADKPDVKSLKPGSF